MEASGQGQWLAGGGAEQYTFAVYCLQPRRFRLETFGGALKMCWLLTTSKLNILAVAAVPYENFLVKQTCHGKSRAR